MFFNYSPTVTVYLTFNAFITSILKLLVTLANSFCRPVSINMLREIEKNWVQEVPVDYV